MKGCVGMEAPCCCGGQFMSAGQLGRLLGAGTAGPRDRTVGRSRGPYHRPDAWPGRPDRPRSRGDRTEREAGWAGDPRHPYDRAGRTVAAPCGLCAAYSEAHHHLTGQVPKLNHLFPRPHHSLPPRIPTAINTHPGQSPKFRSAFERIHRTSHPPTALHQRPVVPTFTTAVPSLSAAANPVVAPMGRLDMPALRAHKVATLDVSRVKRAKRE